MSDRIRKGVFRSDVIVVGGGLVGGSLSLALTGIGLSVTLVEKVPLRDRCQPSYDDRTLALSLASQRIFNGIGLWPGLDDGVTPIRTVHVSNRGHFGSVAIRAEDYGLDALGYVAEGRVIGGAVADELPRRKKLKLLIPARIHSMKAGVDKVLARVSTEQGEVMLEAPLLVGADGTQSTVRGLMRLDTHDHDYGHTAVIANVTPRSDHQGTAYERMTTSGPLALLPHINRRCGVVWCGESAHAEKIMNFTDAEFLSGLQSRFGYRLGRFQKAGQRAMYPISRVFAPDQYRTRSVIVGNAAHTIYPVAAQGFNLGLRDVATLAELIAQARSSGEDIGSEKLLAEYQKRRDPDHRRMIQFTDGMIRAFAPDLLPVNALRSAGMVAIQLLPGLRNALARRTLGLGGYVPRLALGESLAATPDGS